MCVYIYITTVKLPSCINHYVPQLNYVFVRSIVCAVKMLLYISSLSRFILFYLSFHLLTGNYFEL